MRNPTTVANSWVRGMQGAGQKMREGIEAVTVSPGQKAAAAVQLYLQKVQEAVSSGRTARAMAATSLEDWKRAFLEKGVSRVGAGATAATDKQVRFFTWLLPKTDQVKQTIASMPKGTLEESKARAARAIEMMAANKYKGSM